MSYLAAVIFAIGISVAAVGISGLMANLSSRAEAVFMLMIIAAALCGAVAYGLTA